MLERLSKHMERGSELYNKHSHRGHFSGRNLISISRHDISNLMFIVTGAHLVCKYANILIKPVQTLFAGLPLISWLNETTSIGIGKIHGEDKTFAIITFIPGWLTSAITNKFFQSTITNKQLTVITLVLTIARYHFYYPIKLNQPQSLTATGRRSNNHSSLANSTSLDPSKQTLDPAYLSPASPMPTSSFTPMQEVIAARR